MTACGICACELIAQYDIGGIVNDCPRCGRWQAFPSKTSNKTLEEELDSGPNPSLRRTNLSHIVRLQQRETGHVGLPLDQLGQWGLDAHPPHPTAQLDALVLWLGGVQPSHGSGISEQPAALEARLGMAIRAVGRELSWFLGRPEAKSLVSASSLISPGPIRVQLTWAGWARHEELFKSEATSRTAFMAMKFGDAELDHTFASCFRPAVQSTGFELRTLVDGQGAGCIDDQLRVALRTSRFVIADLTHQNPGAYWEAGFAEGLGRPVIYTCRKAEWDIQKTHFDTNHLVTVIWDPNDLGDAAARLKAVVRASLPVEAILQD